MISEKKLRSYTLPVAIAAGLLFHDFLSSYRFLVPYLLFGMMFFTCSKISVKDVKLHPMHGILLLFQILVGVAVYLVLRPINEELAQGLMICVFAPVATASPVVGGLLGANVTVMTTYVLISNVVVALLAPLFFSIIMPDSGVTFFTSFLHISKSTLMLLILPIVISLLIKKYTPKGFEVVKRLQPVSFYLWAVCMMVLIGSTIHTIMIQENSNYLLELIMIVGALLICIVQFSLGRKLGTKYGDMVAGRQMMGQKNTGIAIWLAMAYLTPMSTVAPTAYIIWQNLMNSYEIWKDSRKK